MRIKSYIEGGHAGEGIFTAQGATLSGLLTLVRDPLEPMEAATKKYVDDYQRNVLPTVTYTAEGFTRGSVPASALPTFSGDVTNVEGSNVFTLPVSGVIAGDYPKVEVNAKGFIVSGSELVEDDIPSLPWSKITSGRPTSISGLGITDMLTREGGELTGGIEAHADPMFATNPTTIGYVRSKAETYPDILQVGDVIEKPTNETPFGFLKCNGGIVRKEMYGDLYEATRESYKEVNIVGSGKPWKQQYDINSVGDGLGAWTTATNLPGALDRSQAIVTSNRVYLLGGRIASSWTSTVYTAPINEDGTLGAWTTATSLPGILDESQAIVTLNRVYLLGGRIASSSYVSTVYTAPINEDGTLGAWTTETSLPEALSVSQAVVTSNRVYLLGGHNSSSYVSTVYTAPINEDGTLGAWTTDTSLPGILGWSQAVVTSNRVYLLGGLIGAGTKVVSTVYTAPINEDGTLGAWTTDTSLPEVLGYSQAVVTSNRVYLLGGGNTVSTVYTAPINEDGTLGAWTTDTNSLPEALGYSQAVVTSNRVYLLGGNRGSSNLSTVYTATFSGGKNDYSEYYDGSNNTNLLYKGMYDNHLTSGSGKPWKQQYLINSSQFQPLSEWTQEGNLLRGKTESQVVVTKNRVYLISGNTGGAFVETAPIDEDGKIGTWTDSQPLPVAKYGAEAIVTKNKVYVLGGYHTNTVFSALINEDGTLEPWQTETPLPAAVSLSQAVVTKNRVYLLSGHNNSNIVYTAPIDEEGNIGEWLTAAPLLRSASRSQIAVTKNRVYVLGGLTTGNLVETAEILPDGTLGPWYSDKPLPGVRRDAQVVVTKHRVYLLGQYNDALAYSAPIDAKGIIGDWVTEENLPIARGYSQALITSSRLYLLGGHTGNNQVHSTPFIGGVDDYSKYYDGSVTPINSDTHFQLPSTKDTPNALINSYIKY